MTLFGLWWCVLTIRNSAKSVVGKIALNICITEKICLTICANLFLPSGVLQYHGLLPVGDKGQWLKVKLISGFHILVVASQTL